jgi:hypothetical protein
MHAYVGVGSSKEVSTPTSSAWNAMTQGAKEVYQWALSGRTLGSVYAVCTWSWAMSQTIFQKHWHHAQLFIALVLSIFFFVLLSYDMIDTTVAALVVIGHLLNAIITYGKVCSCTLCDFVTHMLDAVMVIELGTQKSRLTASRKGHRN